MNRTALFDPGVMSEQALDVDKLVYLDDIFITHSHADHLSLDLLSRLTGKFPSVRITAPSDVVNILSQQGIAASSTTPEGATFFDAPHEQVEPLFPQPANIGIHYLDKLTDPGDSHSFAETKPVLALPVTAPWGSTIRAANLAVELGPQYVLPIHDWHWNEAARENTYQLLQQELGKQGITFIPMKTGQSVVLDV